MDLGALIVFGFICFAGYWLFKNWQKNGFNLKKYN